MGNNTLLDHLYRAPLAPTSSQAPAIFLLHGYGSNKEDLFSFVPYLPPEFGIVALNAPIGLPFGGYAWYELEITANMERLSNLNQAKESLTLLQNNISHYCKTYKLNPQKVTAMGFSQGAILSWTLALDHPQLVQQVIGLSGVIDPELLAQPIAHYSGITGFASHGTEDATIPITYPRKTVVALQKNNPNITYKEYAAGHTINPENFQDMLQWVQTYFSKG